MLVKTKYFGEAEIDEKKIIDFSAGLLAFENMKKFFIIDDGGENVPFCWLQSLEKDDLAFVIMNPFLFKPDYEFDIPDEDVKDLALEKKEDVVVFVIVSIPQDISEMTANLVGPLVINAKKMKGKQIVLQDKRYGTKHRILDELKKTGRGGM